MTKIKVEDKVEIAEQVEAKDNSCQVISRSNGPIIINYNGDEIVLSPKQRINIADRAKLTFKSSDAKNIRIV